VNALNRVRHQWTALGERDPLWAILSETDKKDGGWSHAEFFQTGVEEISSAVELNRFPDRCEYIHNVAADLSIFPDASADLIYSSITLQHVVPALARCYIREFFRVVRPGGQVIFQLPCRPRSVVWHAIKSVAPVSVANMIWRLRTGSPEAMETYSMPENKVIKFIEESGGVVLRVEDNQNGPPGWQSRKYFCIRRALP
jgi:SAM-dependent methyltransferase